MQQVWQVRGSYANWTMELRADPVDDPEEGNRVKDWARSRFDGLADHFHEVVNCCEFSQAAEER